MSIYLKNVSSLVIGSGVSQAITLFLLPYFATQFGAEKFAAYSLFLAWVSVFAPSLSGRLDLSVSVARNRHSAALTSTLATWIMLIITFVSVLVVMGTTPNIKELAGLDALGIYVYVLPAGFMFAAFYNLMVSQANCLEEFSIVRNAYIMQTVIFGTTAMLFPYFSEEKNFLIESFIIGNILTASYLFYKNKKKINWSLQVRRRHFVALKRNMSFITLNAPTTLIDSLTIYLPIFFIARDYTSQELASYALVLRMAQAPLSLLSGAISQVHVRETVRLLRQRPKMKRYLMRASLTLSGISIAVLLLYILVGSQIVSYFFRGEWSQASNILTLIAPMLAVRFVASTLSGVFASTNNNHLVAYWRVISFLVTSSVFITLSDRVELFYLLKIFVSLDILMYAAYLVLIWKAALNPRLKI